MFRVYHERDKVITELLGSESRSYRLLILSPLQGEQYADALEQNAIRAEQEPAELVKMDIWGCHVTNRDKKVVVVFKPPLTVVGAIERVPMPAQVARKVADLVRTNCNMAGIGLRFERQGV